jgi:hypothetical protein
VAAPFADHLDGHARLQGKAGVRIPQVVETDAAQPALLDAA